MAGDKNKSGEHSAEPDHEPRINALERTVGDHAVSIKQVETRLAEGDLVFVKIQSNLASLTEKVAALIKAAWWLIATIAFGLLATAGSALLYVVAQMGKHA